MNYSILLLLNSVFNTKLFCFSLKKNYFSHDIFLFLPRSYQRIVIAMLRLNSLLNNSIFLELNSIERVDVSDNKKFTLFYYFFLPFFGTKLCLNFLYDHRFSISSLSHYFQGLEWAEREISDMFGISFSNKKDVRKLLVDYSFSGFPLLKNFSVIGYTELYYDVIEQSLLYIPLQMSESEKLKFKFYN